MKQGRDRQRFRWRRTSNVRRSVRLVDSEDGATRPGWIAYKTTSQMCPCGHDELKTTSNRLRARQSDHGSGPLLRLEASSCDHDALASLSMVSWALVRTRRPHAAGAPLQAACAGAASDDDIYVFGQHQRNTPSRTPEWIQGGRGPLGPKNCPWPKALR